MGKLRLGAKLLTFKSSFTKSAVAWIGLQIGSRCLSGPRVTDHTTARHSGFENYVLVLHKIFRKRC